MPVPTNIDSHRPRICGSAVRVVDTGSLVIDELAGNVATKEDRISIAHVVANASTDEPWLTLHYDEWMCVLKGRMVLLFNDGKEHIEASAGQTIFIEKGTRFQVTFPSDCEYVPVCLPAFRPDRCIREDDPHGAAPEKLRKLHEQPVWPRKESVEKDDAQFPPQLPRRMFKLCSKSERQGFEETGKIMSSLDKKDGFVHLSDRSSTLHVAKLFFKGCSDLRLIEIDASKLPAPTRWMVGSEADPEPDASVRGLAGTLVHFLHPKGCVHIYGSQGVSTMAITREVEVPLGIDGTHVFPDWL